MKKLLSTMMFVTAAAICFAMPLLAQSYSGGAGTSENPYQIATKADLEYLSENSGEWSKHFVQTANITFEESDFLSGGNFYNSGNGFIPIGNNTTKFTGSYNGSNCSISNLKISRSSSDFVGFFGYSYGAISNLSLISVTIHGANYTGGLVGSTWNNVTKCFTSGTVTGSGSNVGGLIGYSYYGTITKSKSTCATTSTSGWTGGLIGFADGGSVTNCFAAGSVTSANSYVGGLLGAYSNVTTSYSYSSGYVNSAVGYHGGLVGLVHPSNTFGSVQNSFWDTQTSALSYSYGGTGKTTTQMKTQSTFTDASWDFTNVWEISESNYPSLQGFVAVTNLSATTEGAASITVSTATVSGTANPAGDTAAVRFLYGTTSGVYTDSVTATPDSVSGMSNTSVSATLTGLNDGTQYYYVLASANATKYVRGSQKSFTTISAVWGSAVKLGTSAGQYAKAGGVATTAIDNITLEAWIKFSGTLTGGVQAIVTNGYAGSDGYGLYLWSGGQIALLESGLGWHYSDSIPPTGTWIHLALVRSGGTWTVYKNGQSFAFNHSDPYLTPITPYTNLFIGGDSLGYKFQGEIDEVRVSNVARYSSNFTVPTAPFVSDGNTVGLYHFDEGSGSAIDDASSNSNNLTLFNSPMWIGSNNPNIIPLPVELTSFTGSVVQNNTELKWKTATEVNNYGFEIEKAVISYQSSVVRWSKVGFVRGNGTINAPAEYSFTDKNLAAGKYSYRLKQIDRDGRFEYSQQIEIHVGNVPNLFALEQNYPNPFNPTTEIRYQMSESGFVILKVSDAIGKEVATLVNEAKEAGSYSVRFDASKLSSGVYFARLQSGGKVQMRKMILMK